MVVLFYIVQILVINVEIVVEMIVEQFVNNVN